MTFTIKTEPEAHQDIQEGIDWYNKQQAGLGRKFYTQVKTSIQNLKSNPFFQVRYDDVHCLPVKNYPYMIHFTINETDKLIIIKAVFNTSENPKNWETR